MDQSSKKPVDYVALGKELGELARKYATGAPTEPQSPPANEDSGKAMLIFPPERKPKT